MYYIYVTRAEVTQQQSGTKIEPLHAVSIIFMSVCNCLCWQLWFANELRVGLGLVFGLKVVVVFVVVVAGLCLWLVLTFFECPLQCENCRGLHVLVLKIFISIIFFLWLSFVWSVHTYEWFTMCMSMSVSIYIFIDMCVFLCTLWGYTNDVCGVFAEWRHHL